MKAATHERNHHLIRELHSEKSSGYVKAFKSVNLAKKESRMIQLANDGLGCGAVRVVE